MPPIGTRPTFDPVPGFGERIAAILEEADDLAERERLADHAYWSRVRSWGPRRKSS